MSLTLFRKLNLLVLDQKAKWLDAADAVMDFFDSQGWELDSVLSFVGDFCPEVWEKYA